MKLLLTLCFTLLLCIIPAIGQSQQPTESVQEEIRRLRLAELNKSLLVIDQLMESLKRQKAEAEAERLKLLQEVAKQQKENTFLESLPLIVARVMDENEVVVIMNGRERTIQLAGIIIKLNREQEAIQLLKEKLAQGLVYVRCDNEVCDKGYLYIKKDAPSLNAELVQWGIGYGAPGTRLEVSASEVAPSTTVEAPNNSSSSSSYSPKRKAGGEVRVKGYYRKDGTYVRPHTRSAPRRKN